MTTPKKSKVLSDVEKKVRAEGRKVQRVRILRTEREKKAEPTKTLLAVVLEALEASDLPVETRKKAIDEIGAIKCNRIAYDKDLIGTPLQSLFVFRAAPSGEEFWKQINKHLYYERKNKTSKKDDGGKANPGRKN